MMDMTSVKGGIPVDSATVLGMGMRSEQSWSAMDLKWEPPGQSVQHEGTGKVKCGIQSLLFNESLRTNICFSDSSLAFMA